MGAIAPVEGQPRPAVDQERERDEHVAVGVHPGGIFLSAGMPLIQAGYR